MKSRTVNPWSNCVFWVVLGAIGLLHASEAPRAKIIGHGHDLLSASPEEILENAAAFDASGLDGVSVVLSGKLADGNGSYSTFDIPMGKGWTREMFGNRAAVLRSFAAHRGLRESLIFGNFMPRKRLGWDDDKAWGVFARNLGLLAGLAKEGGLRGLFLDNEDYPGAKQWRYDARKDGPDYDRIRKLAHRRGLEAGRAIFARHPSAVVMFFWALSENFAYYRTDGDMNRMRERIGDVWPDYLEGLMEAMPPDAKLVDGDENGYFNDAGEFDYYKKYWEQAQAARALLSSDGLKRYVRHLSVSSGIYLDMYVNKPTPGNCWYFGPGADGTRVSRFTANVDQGARVASDYLWIYGEKHALIDWRWDVPHAQSMRRKQYADRIGEGRFTWNSVLPGTTASLRAVTDPAGLASEIFDADDVAKRAGDCLPKGLWDTWCDESLSKGLMTRSDTSDLPPGFKGDVLCASNVVRGCFIKTFPVVPGKLFAVSAWAKGRGVVDITWSGKGKLTNSARHYGLCFDDDSTGWRRLMTCVCTQPCMDHMVIHASTAHRKDVGEITRFADIRIVEVPRR